MNQQSSEIAQRDIVEPMRLLVVEDSAELLGAIVTGLTHCGYGVDQAADGRTGLLMAQERAYDLIVLDVMLPRVDGFTILKTLRDAGSPSRVLMLTAKDGLDDRVKGLRAGADDYLVKPFAFDELIARVEALLRRSRELATECIQIGGLVIDTASRTVRRDGQEITLTPREFAILRFVVQNRGRVVSRTEIEQQVYDNLVEPMSNVVDSAVCMLRRKIDVPGSESIIQTRRGQGYVVPDVPRETQ